MESPVSSIAWADERRRWTQFYDQRLAEQLRRAADRAESAPPADLRPHFESCLSLLHATAERPALGPLWLALVDRLHPLPVRWGHWAIWLAVLRRAAEKTAEPGQAARRAEYVAYVADLLLSTGQFEAALTQAQTAMDLARQSRAVWPLGVAAGVASATLRALARYGEAQALIDTTRAVAVSLPPPPSPARAALAAALIELEQLDLHRHFARPAEALALGETVIARLLAVDGIDPHDLATAYARRATITWAFDQYQAAADDLRRAADLYRRAGDELQATFAEGNLGVVYLSLSRYGEAEALKLAAIRAAEAVNARHTLATELGDLSVAYIGLGRMAAAHEYADRMVKLAAELGDEAELSRGRGNRGYTLLALGRYDEALADIEASLARYQAQRRVEGVLITTVDMVLYWQGVGQTARAAQLARQNYEAALAEDFPKLRIVTARCLALFLSPPERRVLLLETLALARQHGRPMDEAGCLFSLAAIETDAAQGHAYYQAAARLLEQMGATQWLAGKSLADPPSLPLTI
jgi:tetratricopeptide (TPR) repeat protein